MPVRNHFPGSTEASNIVHSISARFDAVVSMMPCYICRALISEFASNRFNVPLEESHVNPGQDQSTTCSLARSPRVLRVADLFEPLDGLAVE